MKKTLLTLVAGASIGAGTVVTLPDGSTAVAELPTSDEIYNSESVSSLKLVQTEDGKAARFIIEKSSSIEGVAPFDEAGQIGDVETTWDAVSAAAKKSCDDLPDCQWTSMDSARNTGDYTTANISDGPIVTIDEVIPELVALKQKILDEN